MRIRAAAERPAAEVGNKTAGEAAVRSHPAEVGVERPAAAAVCQTLQRMVTGESPS